MIFDPFECLEGPNEDCKGRVELRCAPGGQSWPRCEYHDELRWKRYETSIEKYADSDVAPSWFDPSYAGERWDEDD